jgi:hypothetical protein
MVLDWVVVAPTFPAARVPRPPRVAAGRSAVVGKAAAVGPEAVPEQEEGEQEAVLETPPPMVASSNRPDSPPVRAATTNVRRAATQGSMQRPRTRRHTPATVRTANNQV